MQFFRNRRVNAGDGTRRGVANRAEPFFRYQRWRLGGVLYYCNQRKEYTPFFPFEVSFLRTVQCGTKEAAERRHLGRKKWKICRSPFSWVTDKCSTQEASGPENTASETTATYFRRIATCPGQYLLFVNTATARAQKRPRYL